MKAYEAQLQEALDTTRLIDPHCHLNVGNPGSKNLADILQYHHLWIELVSSGMSQTEVTKSGLPQELQSPEIPAVERARRILPFLVNVKNTTIGLFLEWILKDLYGVRRLDEGNFDKVWEIVEKKSNEKAWAERLLGQICNIDYSISVEYKGTPVSPKILKGREMYAISLINGKEGPATILSGWEKYFGNEITSAKEYRNFLEKTVNSLADDDFKFIGLWVLPNMKHHKVDEKDIDRLIGKVRRNEEVSDEQHGEFCYFGVNTLLEKLRRTSIRVIQLIVGAEVLPPHRSITHWDSNFSGSMARLAAANQDFHFNLSSASDNYTQDLGILAKHVPNISVAGYWWHTMYPHYVRKSLETRLEMVPLNKIICYFSDAYHAEWCYPKLKMVKRILKDVLMERIEKEWLTIDTAVDIVKAIFCDNARQIYNIR